MVSPINIAQDEEGHKIVLLPEIIFKNKQNIDWKAVEEYLKRYIGDVVIIAESGERIHLDVNFPNEYKGSLYTKRLKGANAKAKANAVQGIREMLQIATNKRYSENHKEKHLSNAKKGWYYYTTYFAMPIYKDAWKTDQYNVYSACLLVNHAQNGKMYLYDMVDIKKEASTPLKTIE